MSITPSELRLRADQGVRLYRLTREEYERIVAAGILRPSEPFELKSGLLALKGDAVPPYGAPMGNPPDYLWDDRSLLERRPLRRLTAFEYEAMARLGVLDPARRYEMVEGWLIEKMTHNPRHDNALGSTQDALLRFLTAEWCLRIQLGLTLDETTPEPDLVIVPGPRSRYRERHPTPAEAELVIEVADTTLSFDVGMKARSYARNGIQWYWVIDTIHDRIEVFSEPSGPTDEPEFASRQTLDRSMSVPLILRQQTVASLSVAEPHGLS